ncbi:hypothetical protein [Pseudomonas sp. SLFW]|uniref:hypothetical protein n=1 Tax=Pseudomonas sp. SLFW TaxID=2683259 RepID=UPI0014120F52|nr:hypothetical protein [Pseudomonas sp. SLFW]NBB11928.1 hypothetical protein [Pseudomonas sp. SLFW]
MGEDVDDEIDEVDWEEWFAESLPSPDFMSERDQYDNQKTEQPPGGLTNFVTPADNPSLCHTTTYDINNNKS